MAEYRATELRVGALPRVRKLRQESTDAERMLWRLLRGRQMAGYKFRRQHEFGGFILDFYCASARLAVEVDGGQHFADDGIARDEQRTRFLEANGVRVLRFTNLEVLREIDGVLAVISRALGEN